MNARLAVVDRNRRPVSWDKNIARAEEFSCFQAELAPDQMSRFYYEKTSCLQTHQGLHFHI